MDKHGHRVPTLIDPRAAVAQEYGIRWIPVTVIVDQGTIVGRAIGPRNGTARKRSSSSVVAQAIATRFRRGLL